MLQLSPRESGDPAVYSHTPLVPRHCYVSSLKDVRVRLGILAPKRLGKTYFFEKVQEKDRQKKLHLSPRESGNRAFCSHTSLVPRHSYVSSLTDFGGRLGILVTRRLEKQLF